MSPLKIIDNKLYISKWTRKWTTPSVDNQKTSFTNAKVYNHGREATSNVSNQNSSSRKGNLTNNKGS